MIQEQQQVDGPVAVHVVLTPQPGRAQEVLDIVRGVFARIRANEVACLHLAAHVSGESEDIMLYELWSDRAAFTRFVERADMVDYLADLDTRLLARRADLWSRAAG